MQKPTALRVFRTAFFESLREMATLPLWWYARGARLTLGKLMGSVKGSVRFLGVDVWAKNLFVPMYGDESLAGRMISFLVRLTVLIFRSIGLVLWFMIAVMLATVYLLILPVAFVGFVSHLIGIVVLYA